jgi:hypothetical protein
MTNNDQQNSIEKTNDWATRNPLEARANSCVLNREFLLTKKLLNQGFLVVQTKLSLRKFYGRYHDLVNRYGVSVLQMTTDMFRY